MKSVSNTTSKMDMMRTIEKAKDRVMEVKIERNMYLGEYKERVLAAITMLQVQEKGIYPEIVRAIESKEATKVLISRELGFDFAKKYISLAKQKKIPCKLVDSLVNTGKIGLIVAADDAITDDISYNPVVLTRKEKFENAKLPSIYFESLEKEICNFHLEVIKRELPEYLGNFKEIGFLDKCFGTKCPICKKLGGKKRG